MITPQSKCSLHTCGPSCDTIHFIYTLPMTEEFIEDLLTRLLDWVIDTYRSYLNFPRNTPVTLFASTFLIMAEMMRLRYTRLPLGGLQAGADGIGRRAFKIVFAMLVLGVIAIRTVQIFTVSQSIVITVYLVTISVMLGDILGVVLYFVSMVTNWTSLHEGHFASPQVPGFDQSLIQCVLPHGPP
ncbi:hypothetical protein V8B97DRAFT_1496547 [Scleroderma yunnanense]